MSYTFTLSARNSIISNKSYPPVILEENATHVMGLVDFMTVNTNPNIDETNNKFYVGRYELELPVGAYKIDDIERNLKSLLLTESEKETKNEEHVDSTEPPSFTPVKIGVVKINRPLDGKKGVVKKKEVIAKPVLYLKANNNIFKFEIKSSLEIDFTKSNSVATILGL